MLRTETRIRVRYAETDRMGVAYHANYFVWLEVARVDYCRALGFEYRRMEEEHGAALAVTQARCHYRSPARFDDEVAVWTELLEARSRTLRFAYELRLAAEDRLIAEAETLLTVVNGDGRTIRIPTQYRRYFRLDD